MAPRAPKSGRRRTMRSIGFPRKAPREIPVPDSGVLGTGISRRRNTDQRRDALHDALTNHPATVWTTLVQLGRKGASNDAERADVAIMDAVATLLHNGHPTPEQITAAATRIGVARRDLSRAALGAWHGQLIALAQRHPANGALRESIQALALPPRTVPRVLTGAELQALVRDITATIPPTDDNCVVLEEALLDRLHPGGPHWPTAVDDLTVDDTWSLIPGWEDLERVVTDKGKAALARISLKRPTQRPIRMGHRFLLYHAADGLYYIDPSTNTVAPASERPAVLGAAIETYVQVFTGGAQAVPNPFGDTTPAITTPGAITELAPERRDGAVGPGVGPEWEVPFHVPPSDEDVEREDVELAESRLFTVVIDGAYLTRVEIKARLPIQRLADEMGLPSIQEARAGFAYLMSLLKDIPRAGRRVETVFANAPGFRVNPKKRNTLIFPPADPNQKTYVQYTADVPLDGLYDFLLLVYKRLPDDIADETDLDIARQQLGDALEFGIMVAEMFGWTSPPPPTVATAAERTAYYSRALSTMPPLVRALAGFMALVYTQVAPVLLNELYPDTSIKNFTVVTLREGLWRMRKALPFELRLFLDVFGREISTLFESTFELSNPDVMGGLAAKLPPGSNPFTRPSIRRPFSAHDLLMNALDAETARIHRPGLGVAATYHLR